MNRYLKDVLSGFLAGFFIGLGGLAYVVSKNGIGELGQLVGALCFPIGLFMVCLFGVNLYTGKIGYAFNKEVNQFKALDFLIMLVSNLIGAMSIGLISYLMFINNQSMLDTAKAVAASRTVDQNVGGLFGAFFKSMVCGMCVYIAVNLFKKCNNYAEKFLVVLIPIFLFVYTGMNHCIADFYYISFGLSFDIQNFLFILIPIVGNSVGAILFDRAIFLLTKASNK